MYKKEVIQNLIHEIYNVKPDSIEIKSTKEKKRFGLTFDISQKYEKIFGRYYIGTELNCTNLKEYLKVFKELLKIKRFLKTL